MSAVMSECELEALPELGARYGAQGIHEPYSSFGEVDVQHGRPRPRPPWLNEALDLIGRGFLDLNELTDELFFRRHPQRRGTKLKKGETKLINEWRDLRVKANTALKIHNLSHLGGDHESDQFFG